VLTIEVIAGVLMALGVRKAVEMAAGVMVEGCGDSGDGYQ
jgi:hypothetical protein